MIMVDMNHEIMMTMSVWRDQCGPRQQPMIKFYFENLFETIKFDYETLTTHDKSPLITGDKM